MAGTRFPNLPLSTNDQICLLFYAEILAAIWQRELDAEVGQPVDSPICAEVRAIVARAERRGTSEEAA